MSTNNSFNTSNATERTAHCFNLVDTKAICKRFVNRKKKPHAKTRTDSYLRCAFLFEVKSALFDVPYKLRHTTANSLFRNFPVVKTVYCGSLAFQLFVDRKEMFHFLKNVGRQLLD